MRAENGGQFHVCDSNSEHGPISNCDRAWHVVTVTLPVASRLYLCGYTDTLPRF